MKEAKKNSWLVPNEICIAHGAAVARNLMFVKRRDHKLFLKYWDKYLGDMTEVLQYHLAPDQWTVLFRTKSTEEITEAYRRQRMKSRKANPSFTLTEPKRMLSEHMRIFLSQYVRTLNVRLGRKGGLVMERFRKYVLKQPMDYNRFFALLTQQVRFRTQTHERFRANDEEHDMANEMPKGSIWQVGTRVYEGLYGVGEVLKCMRLLRPESSVLRKLFLNRNSCIPLPNSS